MASSRHGDDRRGGGRRGARLTLELPLDPEALLDEDAFDRDEFMPYWAEVWPSGLALARHVAGLDLTGLAVLELGCGLGLPSLVASLAGRTSWRATGPPTL